MIPSDGLLLTHEEQLAKLDSLFGQYENKGKIFSPTTEFYDLLATSDGLLTAAKQLYRWLGIKPYHLSVTFSAPKTSRPRATHVSSIVIPREYAAQPYEVGALLTQEVLRHILVHRKHYKPDNLFLEFASIHCGFGLLVLNGLGRKSPRLRRALGFQKNSGAPLRLSALATADYADGLMEYAGLYAADLTEYLTFMTQYTQTALTPLLKFKVQKVPLPQAVRAEHRAKRLWTLKAALLMLLVLIPVVMGLFVWSLRPHEPSTAAITQYHKLTVLEANYRTCTAEARRQQNTYDLNDIFMQRQIDATLVRCASLHNQYNYEADQYNKMITR